MPEEIVTEESVEEPKVEAKPEEEEPQEPLPEPKKVEDEEPPKRFPKQEQSPVEKQIGYLTRKMETLEKENQELKTSVLPNWATEDEDEKPVTRKELAELLEKKDRETTSRRMVDEFIGQNPDYKRYEERIRKFVDDPDYANVSIGFIASGIRAQNIDDEINERAKVKAEADLEAEKTKSGGSSKRSIPGKKKSVWDMTKDEFEQHQAEVLQRKD